MRVTSSSPPSNISFNTDALRRPLAARAPCASRRLTLRYRARGKMALTVALHSTGLGDWLARQCAKAHALSLVTSLGGAPGRAGELERPHPGDIGALAPGRVGAMRSLPRWQGRGQPVSLVLGWAGSQWRSGGSRKVASGSGPAASCPWGSLPHNMAANTDALRRPPAVPAPLTRRRLPLR